ncbi:MAG: MBL fold metallo-hydrolase [Nitrospinae bacterium]|nr:MBL fold metallo-hydrolase [Nitrospinota bacterium]
MVKIRFLGAAGMVTGSCYMVTAGKEKIIVDCGLFQGGHDTFMMNYASFGFRPEEISCVILSHAHADHSGRLPLLSKRGFTGDIHAHSATADLGEIILLDSAHIHEVEAGWRTRKNLRRGEKHIDPLYTVKDAERSLRLFKRTVYHKPVKISDRLSFTFHDAGHILGSSIVELLVKRDDGSVATIVFSGDLGRASQPIIKNPETLSHADYLLIESTYGARKHKPIGDTKDELAAILNEAARTNGNVIIPAFAVGRTQEALFYIRELFEEGRVPPNYRKIYVDSPMATSVTEVYERALRECYDTNSLKMLENHQSPLRFEGLHFVSSVEESMFLNMTRNGQIIISASGMCDAGRILHHLRHNLWNENSHIVFVGYQAEGTKGRKLVDGASSVKIMREEIAVRAKIHTLNALSAHADGDGLYDWAKNFKTPPALTMIVHGEKEQAEGLKERLAKGLGYKCTIPALGEEIPLVGA